MRHTREDRAQSLSRKRKHRRARIVLWLAGVLLALAFIGFSIGALWLRSAEKAALPVLDGDVQVAGLSAPVTVRRDGHGVPHIDAATQDDMLVAQGYVTAQDRLWQMDMYRRNAGGELAEVLGPSLVKQDETQRVLQFKRTAQRMYASLPEADRARLDDYARGVNLFIEASQSAGTLPAEFKLLGYKPEPWTGVDSISVGLMVMQMLDEHWPTKLSRARIAADLHNPKLESDLYPVGSWRDHPPTGILLDLSQPHPEPPPSTNDDDDDEDEPSTASAAPMERLQPGVLDNRNELLEQLGLRTCDGCRPGSNNWVIAGAHTASGKPLLANDMHLDLLVPNIWYMADLSAPGFHAAGVTIPGMPFVIAGHNEHVAWGITALMGDVQDLYEEKLDGQGNYEADDGTWKPLAIDREVIKVRGGRDVALDVESTGHGPLLNPILTKDSAPVALKWTLYDTALNSMPVYRLNTAANWTEFSSALADWCWPTLNIVYADDRGHIAYYAVGRIPFRPGKTAPPATVAAAGQNPGVMAGPTPGVIPHLGVIFDRPVAHAADDDHHEWQGYIPFDEMPSSVDPPSGFLATANSRVITGDSKYLITNEWVEPYRIERIYKMLEGRNGLAPKDMLAAQTDIYSEMDQEFGQRLAYAIDHTADVDARLRQAADLMRIWDGKLTADSAAASLVTQARRALWPLILEPKLGKDAASYHWEESNFAEEEIVMHAKADWLPANYKNWDELLTAAVRKGMDDGKATGDVSKWTYGSWHVIDLEHPLARFLPIVAGIATRIAGTGPQPLSGDTTTVKQVGRHFGPSQRFTMDWSNVDGSTENIVLGESSNPYSAYYRDQWNDYYGGTTFALPFTPAAVGAQTRHTLRLAP
jgi:penicillin amidase